MKRHEASIEFDVQKQCMRVTIEVANRDLISCPPMPKECSFGDDWICAQTQQQLGDLGYWTIPPEHVAAQLLRAAWVIAHQEKTGQ